MVNKNKNNRVLKRAGLVVFKSKQPKRDEQNRIVVYQNSEEVLRRYLQKGETIRYTRIGLKSESADIHVKSLEKETAWVRLEKKK